MAKKKKTAKRSKNSRARSPKRELTALFWRNGYVRWQDPARAVDSNVYKKGDEVRLVADTKQELAHIRKLLKDAGFEPGRPFAKGNQYRQPIYKKDAVARFLDMVGAEPPR
jgi:hypothetical protein